MGLEPTNEWLPYAQFQIAMCRYSSPSNNVGGATNSLAELFERYPKSPKAVEGRNLLADIYISQQDYTAASETLRILAEKHPDQPIAREAAYRAGEMLVLNRKPLNALPMFIQAYRSYPDSGWSLYALVRAGEVATDPLVVTNTTRLADWFVQLDELSNSAASAAAVCGLAKAAVLTRVGDGPGAQRACAAAASATLPDDIRGYALAIRAGAANAASNFAEGATLAAQAVQAGGASGVGLNEALIQQGHALFCQQKWSEAAAVYSSLFVRVETGFMIPNARQAAEAYLEGAQSLIELGAQDTSLIVYLCDQVVQLKAGSEFAARGGMLKGDAFLKQNDLKKAALYYKQVVVRHGKLARYAVPAYRGLIGCLDKLGLTEDAAKARQEFTVRYPDAAKTN